MKRGITLIELLAVMFSTLVVGAFAFHMMLETTDAVHKGMSVSSRADRLRLLQRAMDHDLGARYPNATSAPLEIGPATPTVPGRTLIRTQILVPAIDGEITLQELTYNVVPSASDVVFLEVNRTLDPDTAAGIGPDAKKQSLFYLGRTENLVWDRTGENYLSLRFEDSRFPDRPVPRQLLLQGGQL